MYGNENAPDEPIINNALRRFGGYANASNSIGGSDGSLAPRVPSLPILPANTVINMSNSNDVVIGTSTVYQAPVTIYMDATVEGHSRIGYHTEQRTQQVSMVERLQNISKITIILFVILLGLVGIVLYFLLAKNPTTSETKKDILFGNNYESGTFPNLGDGHLIVDRYQWGAQDKSCNHTLLAPVPYVIITHVGVQSSPCSNVYKCSIKMRTFQDAAIAEQGKCDIAANFYVGDDGNVYVGRGWNLTNFYSDKTLAIAFMGDYIRNEPPERQLTAVEYLLAYGLTNQHIALDYKLVAHNQTRSTRSPGVNVFKHIRKLPHWYACGMENNKKCGEEIGIPTPWMGVDGG